MADRSSLILAVFDNTPGGTKYTLDYAARQKLDILLLDPANPGAPAVRLEIPEEQENFFDFPIDKDHPL